MKNNWLWDRKISDSRARKILKDPKQKNFILLAALLLSRKNEPKDVFKKYMNPLLFCRQWAVIKRRMRKDKWSEPRITFWQAIYEALLNKYRKQGVAFRREVPFVKNPLCEKIGKELRNIRKRQGLSQGELAKKMDVSQQLISRIEKGKENISLSTLNDVSGALGQKIQINLTA